jgi:hypothetical protein
MAAMKIVRPIRDKRLDGWNFRFSFKNGCILCGPVPDTRGKVNEMGMVS